MVDWLNLWNQKANTENYFTQTGRGNSFTMYQFLLYIQDVNNSLGLSKSDIFLDAGGGPGWTTFHLAPFVAEVTMFDYSHEMIKKARKQAKQFPNVYIYQDDILKMKHIKGEFDKVLVGSILQYLNNMDEVETAMQNIYNVMKTGGRALFTHNPDLMKKDEHIKAIKRKNGKEALKQENERLWINPLSIEHCAINRIGFSKYSFPPINPQIWQSGHMFDFLIVK